MHSVIKGLFMSDDAIAALVKRAKRVKAGHRQWMILFEELAHYFHHIRKGFWEEITPGTELQEDIQNDWPETARAQLADGLVAAMIPRDRMWVGMRPSTTELYDIPIVKFWLTVAAHRMYTVLYDPLARFVETVHELVDDASAFGTAVLYVDFDRVKKHLILKVKHLKNFAFEHDAGGGLTRSYCFYMFSVDDLVQEFGLDKLPQEMQEEYRNTETSAGSSEKKYEVIQAIVPNEDYARFGLAPGRLPLRSLWILCKGSHVLDEGGYYESPYVPVFWYRRSDEPFGRGRAEMALADARLLQAVTISLREITEKQANPPMQGPVDILRGEIELFPGGFTAFDASGFQFQGDPLRPVQIGSQPAMTAEYLEYLEGKIGRIFFADAVMGPPQKGMSEADQMAHAQMIAVKLGPVYARVEAELLPPILDRVFNIMLRNRAFPPIPEELEGERLIYLFDNHVADMREMAEAGRSINALGSTAQLAEIPGAGAALEENVDWDTAFRDIWDKMKVPPTYLLPVEQVMANRQQRQQMEQAQQMAALAKDAGPGLKQTVEGAVTARDQGLLPSPQ